MEGKLVPVERDSPYRCQAVVSSGQCIYKAIEGLPNCSMHAGAAQDHIKKQKIRNYNLQRYRQIVNEKADNDGIKSLREEIGILRLLMEQTINRCKDDTELMIFSPKIADLALKIEKIVLSCHKLESSLGQSLDKTAVLNIGTKIVNIISEFVKDENIINAIVEEIGKMVTET